MRRCKLMGISLAYPLTHVYLLRTRTRANLTRRKAKLLGCLIQWPASAEMGTPGKSIAPNEPQMPRQHRPTERRKLTACAMSHEKTYRALSEAQLNAKERLPCGLHAVAGAGCGYYDDVFHPPVMCTVKNLCKSQQQHAHCTYDCNKRMMHMPGEFFFFSRLHF